MKATKNSARCRVRWALRQGQLQKPERCEGCGTDEFDLHGHHDDYSKPLEVRWLCRRCHAEQHRTKPKWLPQAKRLREEGATYAEIARRVGVSPDGVWKRLNPRAAVEMNRRSNAKRREAKRLHEKQRIRDLEWRGRCQECGEPMGIGVPEDGICVVCTHKVAERRVRQVEEWWAEGISFLEIANRLGVTKGCLSGSFDRWRKLGYSLPYRYAGVSARHAARSV